MKRIFLGINLPEMLKNDIENLKLEFKLKSLPINLVEPDNSHITIKFFGDLNDDQIDELNKKIANELGKFKSFTIKIENSLVFPDLSKPKVLSLKVISPNLNGLATKLFNSFADFNFYKPDEKPYTYHITLGRFKNKLNDQEKENISNLKYENDFSVDSIQLFESKLTDGGHNYHVLKNFDLK